MVSIVPPLVDALLAQGLDDEGLQLAELVAQKSVSEDIDAPAGWRRVRAKLLARRGDLPEAERLARDAMAIADRTDYLELRAQVKVDLADILDLAHRPEQAASSRAEALRLFEQKGNLVAVASLRNARDVAAQA